MKPQEARAALQPSSCARRWCVTGPESVHSLPVVLIEKCPDLERERLANTSQRAAARVAIGTLMELLQSLVSTGSVRTTSRLVGESARKQASRSLAVDDRNISAAPIEGQQGFET